MAADQLEDAISAVMLRLDLLGLTLEEASRLLEAYSGDVSVALREVTPEQKEALARLGLLLRAHEHRGKQAFGERKDAG